MPYPDPLDPTTPDDNDVAGEGDDRLRELKRALIQRLGTVFQDLDADPLKLIVDFLDLAIDISDGTIPGAKLVNSSVPLSKLAALPGIDPGAVGTSEIADGAVTEPKLADNAVTNAKLADDAVGTDQIADAVLKRVHLYAGLKTDLCRFQSYTLTLGSAVVAAGEVFRGSVNVDTNDQLGGAVACVIEPAYSFSEASAAAHVTDYVLAQCSITLNGAQEVLVYRLHNLLAAPIDLTGQVYYIHMIQRLSTAPAET